MEETPVADSVSQEVPQEMLPPEPTPEQIAQADQLMRQANLARVRGQKDVAEKLMEEARTVAPGSVAVLEAIGDEFADRKQMKKAMEVYKQAMAIDPSRVSVERKYAELVLKNSVLTDPFALSGPDSGTMASGKIAAIMSIVVPGLGQVVTGQVNKGIIMFVGCALGWLWLVIPVGGPHAKIEGLLTLVNSKIGVPLEPSAFVALFVAMGFHLWSMFDAASNAKRWTPPRIDRPVPPSDRDFEL